MIDNLWLLYAMHLWQTIRSASVDRHIHAVPYASIVLSGGYEEAGDHGRFRVSAGDVIFHERFEAHLDRFSKGETVVLNLNLGTDCKMPPGLARIRDVDGLVRIAEKDQNEALNFLVTSATRCDAGAFDWEDELCRALRGDGSVQLTEWAQRNGLSPWTVSRGFREVFAVTPESFRARSRARRAWRRICDTQGSLAKIALEVGFTDQSHMTQGIKQLTGITPAKWRPANGSKTVRS
jgi:AraC-like DNA-binding protein